MKSDAWLRHQEQFPRSSGNTRKQEQEFNAAYEAGYRAASQGSTIRTIEKETPIDRD